jgi:hypothetical protein
MGEYAVAIAVAYLGNFLDLRCDLLEDGQRHCRVHVTVVVQEDLHDRLRIRAQLADHGQRHVLVSKRAETRQHRNTELLSGNTTTRTQEYRVAQWHHHNMRHSTLHQPVRRRQDLEEYGIEQRADLRFEVHFEVLNQRPEDGGRQAVASRNSRERCWMKRAASAAAPGSGYAPKYRLDGSHSVLEQRDDQVLFDVLDERRRGPKNGTSVVENRQQ